MPVAADAVTFDQAMEEMIEALREYADDWQERLLDAPNHRNGWALIQVVELSGDAQLREWLVGAAHSFARSDRDRRPAIGMGLMEGRDSGRKSRAGWSGYAEQRHYVVATDLASLHVRSTGR